VTVPTPSAIDIRLAATFAEMSVDELDRAQPRPQSPMISGPHTQTWCCPRTASSVPEKPRRYDQPLTSWQPYTMKGGDNSSGSPRNTASRSPSSARERHHLAPESRPGLPAAAAPQGIGVGAQPLPAVFRPPVRSAPRKGGLVHVVKKGETLYGISRRYRVSTDSLLRWNHVGVLTTGQRSSSIARRQGAQGCQSGQGFGRQPKQNAVASLLPAGQQ